MAGGLWAAIRVSACWQEPSVKIAVNSVEGDHETFCAESRVYLLGCAIPYVPLSKCGLRSVCEAPQVSGPRVRGAPCLCAYEARNTNKDLPLICRVFFFCDLLLRPRCVAAGNGLGTGLGTTAKYVRCSTSDAVGNGLGNTIKKTATNKEWHREQRPRHHGQVPVINNCRGQPPGHHDQVPGWRRENRPGHHGEVPRRVFVLGARAAVVCSLTKSTPAHVLYFFGGSKWHSYIKK